MTGHLFVNAFTFYFMAPAVQSVLGNTRFLALYLGGAYILGCLPQVLISDGHM